MTIEISVESYLFTCVQCSARWAEDYQVSQVIDDAGVLRSFYRSHGGPCEAPVSGNIRCPNCHATRARRDPLYGAVPDLGLADPGGPPLPLPASVPVPRGGGSADQAGRGAGGRAGRRGGHHASPGSWHRFKFSAVVALEAAGRPGGRYLSGASGLMVRAPSLRPPARYQYFPAVIYTDDARPLRPGDKGVSVVISVPDDDAAGFFQAGQHFTLWDGADVGSGTVAQRLFFSWP